MLAVRLLLLLQLSRTCTAVSSDPWAQCPANRRCEEKFADGSCDRECLEAECLRDGFDCQKDRSPCNPGHIPYCRDHYADSHCELGCDSAPCGWDGGDCLQQQSPEWARGSLLLHTSIPLLHGSFSNSSLLWALSILLQSPLRLRGSAPLASNRNLFHLDPQQLADLLTQPAPPNANGSLLFLQVDNRACSRSPNSCFRWAEEAASFLRAALLLRPPAFPSPTELKAVVGLRGVRQELGEREEEEEKEQQEEEGEATKLTPAWLWAVVAMATALLLALPLAAVLVVRRVRRRRWEERDGGDRETRRSKSNNIQGKAKAWAPQTTQNQEQRVRTHREDRISLRKKKKAKEAEKKRRREPLGEDAIRMRPLRRDQDVGSDTDFTQSSMEDVNMRSSRRQEDASICDHRNQQQQAYRPGAPLPRRAPQAPPVGWERTAMSPPLLSPPQQSAEWCGPDGSVVLIRAVRSGLDRVVLELLRAGVPVNNTDHTGRSALHWACSVNHVTLARTLVRYGASVDLQDNKGETPLFLAALHGCYDASRLLLLHGADLTLPDRRGRRPLDAAREGLHQQVLELLLAHQVQVHRVHRGPTGVPGGVPGGVTGGVPGGVPADSSGDAMMWEERAMMYSPWAAAQGLPGRSNSFSGTVGHRETPPPHSDWSMARVQYPAPQNWRPQLNQSATALVPPRIMGRSPRPISTLQEVTSEDEDRHQEAPRAATPHFLSPQPAPRQRSFSCSQHALQRRSAPQPENNYLIVTERGGAGPIGRVLAPPSGEEAPPTERHSGEEAPLTARYSGEEAPPTGRHQGVSSSRADPAAGSSTTNEKPRRERTNNPESTQTAL